MQSCQSRMQVDNPGKQDEGGEAPRAHLAPVVGQPAPSASHPFQTRRPNNPSPPPSERKIDQFEARLAGIEGLLQDMSSRLPGRVDDRKTDHDGIAAGMRTYTSPSGLSTANTAYEEQPSALSAPENVAKHTRMHMYNTAETPSVSSVGGDDPLQFDGAASFEGTSSMAAQTAYASDFVEQALTGNTPMQTNASAHPYMGGDGALAAQPDMQKALAALRKMAQQQQQQQEHRGSQQPARSPSSHFSRQKPVPRGGVCHLPLPPTDVVLKLLREIRGVW